MSGHGRWPNVDGGWQGRRVAAVDGVLPKSTRRTGVVTRDPGDGYITVQRHGIMKGSERWARSCWVLDETIPDTEGPLTDYPSERSGG